MENLYIGKRGVKRYDIRIVPYTKHECYFVEILPTDVPEHRRCKLLGFGCNGTMIEFEASIVDGIVSVCELESKLKEKQKVEEKLKVLVYGMEFNPWPVIRRFKWNEIYYKHYQRFSFVPKSGC